MSDYVDPRKRRVLEFVIPILYLEKLNRVTKTMGDTIFGALSEVWKVNWRQVIQEVVEQLVSNLEKGKASPLAHISSTSTTGMNALEGEKWKN